MDKTDNILLVTLTKEDLESLCSKAAEVGAKTAIEKLHEERKYMNQKAINRRLRNTRLLLKNYRMLKENVDNSIFGRSQMEESAADILCSMMNLYDDEVIVDSIKRSATRTAIIVSHVEAMLSIYKGYCERSSNDLNRRRYEVMYDKYIAKDPLSTRQIADKQNMSKENVYADLKEAIERLSALIFGVDGLRIN